MPRPKTKEELLHLSKANFEELEAYIDGMDPALQEKEFPKGTMNRNVRDILAHLHHWHLMMRGWHDEGMKGLKPAMPAEGYTWRTVPDLNRKIWEQYSNEGLENVRKLLRDSYEDIQKIIRSHSDEDLFEKKKYKWTGSTSMGSYLVSATSSHYDWGLKMIKKALK